MQRRRIGAARVCTAMYSTRSRKVGSPHWMSSKTTTSGRRRASASKSLPIAQNVPRCPGGLGDADASATRVTIRSASSAARRRARDLVRAASGDSSPLEPGRLARSRSDRPEGDALAVGQATPAQRPSPRRRRARNSCDETRLPDAGGPSDGDQLGRRVAYDARRTPGRAARARGRGRRAATSSRRAGDRAPHVEQANRRRRRSALPLSEAARRLDRDGVAHEPVSALADQDLARLRRLLEPRGDVDRVTGRERLTAPPGRRRRPRPC